MTKISIEALVTGEHLDSTRHTVKAWKVEPVLVDGDFTVEAMPCECGRWVEVPNGD
jgi:hypothetical protein